MVARAMLDAEPQELVRGTTRAFTLLHRFLEARPTLRDCTLVEIQGLTDGVPVDLYNMLACLPSIWVI